jgi:Skp family chaperone for outer membrane proteins
MSTIMTSKFTRFLLAACVLSVAALAQTDKAAAASPLPAAPSASTGAAGAGAINTTNYTGTKIGTINIEQAIYATNEGQRDFEALGKKLEPKQSELKGLNDEVESLKKQLNTQGDKLNDEARADLVKQIQDKQKSLDRKVQDARDDAQSQQNEIAQRILQKMAPILVKYAGENGFGVVMDTSQAWPQGQVLWAGPSVDITKAVVDAYNAQSKVPPPTASNSKPAARPGAPKAGTPAKQTSAPPK